MSHTFPTETYLRTWNSKGDAFGCQDLAKRVVENILTKMETPNVLGIYGDWGTGKTTFLHYLQMVITGKQKNEKEEEVDIDNKELNDFRASFKGDLDKIEVIHFEPWKYEYAEGTDLLLKLIEKIENSLLTKTKVWKKLKKIVRDISGEISLEDFSKDIITFSVLLSSFLLSFGSLIFTHIQKAILFIGLLSSSSILNKIFFLFKKRNNSEKEDPFEQVSILFLKAINETIGKGKDKEKIIIFIDDLDRCLPENTIKLLEAMKNFLYQRGVVFVLAIDQRVVSEMVEKKYGLHSGYGDEYLEKIINYRFILPKVEYRDVVIKIFQDHAIEIPSSEIDWMVDFVKVFLNEPRKAGRFLRQFAMSLLFSNGKKRDDPGHVFFQNKIYYINYIFIAIYLQSSYTKHFSGSANQVGKNIRFFLGHAINPDLTTFSKKDIGELQSFAQYFAAKERPLNVDWLTDAFVELNSII